MIQNTPWLSITKDDHVLINISLQPAAKQNAIMGILGDSLKIRVRAKPVDQEANLQLIKFLADSLKISKSSISIVKGLTSRKKK